MTTDYQRLCGMLGLARRAGRLTIGTEQVCLAMAERPAERPALVLISHTASAATKKKVTVKGAYYGVPVRQIPISTDELGHLIGKSTSPASVAVRDVHMAAQIERLLGSVTSATKG